jgi:hypothetical protein
MDYESIQVETGRYRIPSMFANIGSKKLAIQPTEDRQAATIAVAKRYEMRSLPPNQIRRSNAPRSRHHRIHQYAHHWPSRCLRIRTSLHALRWLGFIKVRAPWGNDEWYSSNFKGCKNRKSIACLEKRGDLVEDVPTQRSDASLIYAFLKRLGYLL